MSGFLPEDQPPQEELNNCIRCGMCLPTCPTYQLTGRERSSPRGRISLMRAVSEGHLPLESETFAKEMSDCLGCLACVTACPAGVQYGELLERSRDQLWRHRAPQWPWWKRHGAQLLLAIVNQPLILSWLTRLLYLYQVTPLPRLVNRLPLPGQLKEFHRMMPTVGWKSGRQQLRSHYPGPRGRVGVLLGCVMDVMFVPENLATVRVLRRQGYEVLTLPQQGCCGALHAHAGQLQEARKLAKKLIDSFTSVDFVVVNSAGCGSCMKHYPQLFEHDQEWQEKAQKFVAKVRDIQEFLHEFPLDPPIPSKDQPLTYHDACHLAHGQSIRQAPRQLLQQLAGSGYRELQDADLCCGSAGTYNLTHFETASQLLDKKLDAIQASGAKVVGVANPGCLLQIRYGIKRRGLKIRAEHPVVLLDEAWSEHEPDSF